MHVTESGASLCLQGADAHRAGNLPEALAAFDLACTRAPAMAAAWNGRAVILAEMGRSNEAITVLAEAVIATGGDTSILTNMAVLQERQGHHAEAVETAQRILNTEPNHTTARFTLGLALLRLRRPNESIHHYRHLTAAHPEFSEAYLNLGEACMAADEYREALAAYERAIELEPTMIAAKIGQGQALAMLKRFNAADMVFLESARLNPDETHACFQRMATRAGQRIPFGWQPRAVEVFLSRHWTRQQNCDWLDRDTYLRELRSYAEHLGSEKKSAHDESLAFQSLATSLTIQQRRDLLDAVAAGVLATVPVSTRRRVTRPSGPLRLGFLSTGFRDHPSAQLHWRHFTLYDRRRFRVHAYSLVPDPTGHMRDKVAGSVDCFRDLSRATAEEARWRIARDGIDILVDLAGYQDNARPEILAARPATLQVSYHGSPLSMTRSLVDYRITDRIASPDASEFTEAAAFVPAPHYMYNDAEPVAAGIPSRRECGLPEAGTVFCAFNNAFKIEPEVFGVWMELLREFPDSVLWLSDGGTQMRDNLRHEASARGIAGERLVFAPRIERAGHLARHACADLFLDTFYCNAHTTAVDALWAGLPVLTRAGDTMTSRLAASLVTSAGLPELVASTTGDYLAVARELASTPERLAELRQRLMANRKNSRLFATERRVRHLERAFETMWERHCRGEPPASFDVPDEETRS